MRDSHQSNGYVHAGDERTLPGDVTYPVAPGQPDRQLRLSLYPVRPGGAAMPRSKFPYRICLFYAAGSLHYHLQQSWIAHLLLFEHIAHNHGPVLRVFLTGAWSTRQDRRAYRSQRYAQHVFLTEIQAETLDLAAANNACQRIRQAYMGDQARLVVWYRNHQVKLISNLEALLRSSLAFKANFSRQLAIEGPPILNYLRSHLDSNDPFKAAQRFDLASISQRVGQAHLLSVEQYAPCLGVSDNPRIAQPDHQGQACRRIDGAVEAALFIQLAGQVVCCCDSFGKITRFFRCEQCGGRVGSLLARGNGHAPQTV